MFRVVHPLCESAFLAGFWVPALGGLKHDKAQCTCMMKYEAFIQAYCYPEKVKDILRKTITFHANGTRETPKA